MRWTKKKHKTGDTRKVTRFAWRPVEDVYGNNVWLEFYYAHENYEGNGKWKLDKIEYDNDWIDDTFPEW